MPGLLGTASEWSERGARALNATIHEGAADGDWFLKPVLFRALLGELGRAA